MLAIASASLLLELSGSEFGLRGVFTAIGNVLLGKRCVALFFSMSKMLWQWVILSWNSSCEEFRDRVCEAFLLSPCVEHAFASFKTLNIMSRIISLLVDI